MKTSPEVDAWFASSSHPLKAEMMRVREVVLSADPRMAECIKWQTPTFTFGGNLASFNPNTKAHVSLMFHTGAKIPGSFARLQGTGDTARYMKLSDMAEVEAAAEELRAIVAAWCASKANGATPKAPRKAAAAQTNGAAVVTPGQAKPRSAGKKAAVKKVAAKKVAAKKPAAKKPAAKKPAAAKKKPAAKKQPAKKKPAVKKAAAKKKPAVKKASKKKAAAKKQPAKKKPAAKQKSVKRRAAKK